MNKKIIIPVIIIAIVVIAIIGIILIQNKNNGETKEVVKEETYYKIGDTVSTDIAEFTLNSSELTIALSNHNDDTYYMPKEYNAKVDAMNPYVADTGHTFAYVDYTLSAIDRSDLNIDNGSLFQVTYNNQKYNGNLKIGLEKIESSNFQNKQIGKWIKYNASNMLISKGGKTQYRGYIDINTDIKNLKEKYYIICKIPNSQGTRTTFTYVINAES